jgi:hypothetical protein
MSQYIPPSPQNILPRHGAKFYPLLSMFVISLQWDAIIITARVENVRKSAMIAEKYLEATVQDLG